MAYFGAALQDEGNFAIQGLLFLHEWRGFIPEFFGKLKVASAKVKSNL